MARSRNGTESARELAVLAARTARDYNTEDIVVLDLRNLSPVTEYFVIGTGTSPRQLRTVADSVAKAGEAAGQQVWRTAGAETGNWILLDFVDVVVHLFDSAHRAYYDLELIWGGAPRVDWAAGEAKPVQG